MPKSDVYSWRLSPETRATLEEVARRENTTIAGLLERMVQAWSAERRTDSRAEQARLHARAARVIGSIAGGNRGRSESVRKTVRDRLNRRRFG